MKTSPSLAPDWSTAAICEQLFTRLFKCYSRFIGSSNTCTDHSFATVIDKTQLISSTALYPPIHTVYTGSFS